MIALPTRVWAASVCVIDGRTANGRLRETHLSFEDFLEALCRLALIKALPSDYECRFHGCADAGDFLLRLSAGQLGGLEYAEFVASHRGEVCATCKTIRPSVPRGALQPLALLMGDGTRRVWTVG